jgi:energy-coupling factor transporter ATP-binding protein EcfA2
LAKSASGPLLQHTRALADALRELRFMEGTELGERFDALKRSALALLDGKIVPELTAEMKLPLFVAICGGTNTGKSTVVNAVAGLLLTETRVTAGATKHPFVYLHAKWEKRMLSGKIFPGVECVKLSDPVELTVPSDEPRMYMSFHERRELQNVAIVDSPDLDSVEGRNRAAAEAVLTLADVCLFVTTPQKYKDRVLVDDVRAVADRKKRVVMLFNQVEDEIVYNTIAEDVRPRLEGVELGGFVPFSRERRPEVALRPRVLELVEPCLDTRRRLDLKRRTMRHGLEALVAQVRELIVSTRAEAERKRQIAEEAGRQLERAEAEYSAGAPLPFPETGVALRRQLSALEAHRVLAPAGGDAPARAVELARQALALGGRRLTAWFADTFDAGRSPESWETLRAERDREDLRRIQQLALLLRSRIDARLRAQASSSQLALALLHRFFGDEDLDLYEQEVEQAFERARAERADVGGALMEAVADPDAPAAPRRRGRAALAALLKTAGGLGLAYATYGFGGWDLLFFPGGFLAGGYALALGLHLSHRRWRDRFDAACRERFRAVCERVLVGPFLEAVREVASEDDLGRLEDLCAAIEAGHV